MSGSSRRRLARAVVWTVVAVVAVGAAVAAGTSWWQRRGPGPGPVRIGYWDRPPLYFAPDGHPPEGVAIEVLAAAARRLGVAVTWVRLPANAATAAAFIRSGAIDLWPTAPVEAASKDMLVTEPWLDSRFLLITRPGVLRNGSDLAGRTVALVPVRTAEAMFGRALKGAARLTFDRFEDTLEAVCAGRADAAFIEGRQLQWLLLNRPPGCAGVPLAFEPLAGTSILYGIGSTAAAAPYARALREEIARMGEDTTLAGIHDRWSLTTGAETRLIYALQEERARTRLSRYGIVGVSLALLLALWQVQRIAAARRLAVQASTAMEEYARQQERYRLLVERNVAGVAQTTTDGRVLVCNRAFARMLGYGSPDEVLALPAWHLYVDRAGREATLARLAEERTVSNQLVQVRRKDGSSGWLIESVSLIDQDPGQPAIVEITTIDDTEHRRLEEQYRQAQKLESVGRLAGGVAHDFNNLLTAIIGYCELGIADASGSGPVRKALDEIRKAAERAAALTQQLLAFSRKQLLQPVVLNVNDVVTDARNLLQRVIGEDLTLETDLDPALGRVRADPGQLHQVVMNLAVNARDAMPNGGTLILETRNVEVAPGGPNADPDTAAGPCVRLRVRDTGHGMDDETRRRVFEPFFTTKELGRGTGLGLSTVYGIIRQSGGHVHLESTPGQGTTFDVYLPRVEGPAAARAGAESGGAAGPGTVLLVGDQDEARRFATEALARQGFRVLAAADTRAAIEVSRVHAGPIHLLVAGLSTSGTSGPALADRLRDDRPNLRVLFIAGNDEAVNGWAADSAAILRQPFTPSQLVQEALNAIRGPADGEGVTGRSSDGPGRRILGRESGDAG